MTTLEARILANKDALTEKEKQDLFDWVWLRVYSRDAHVQSVRHEAYLQLEDCR